ncbi:MAG TPA: STAS domain-containing protein [Pseudonocardiaceae bacterium]
MNPLNPVPGPQHPDLADGAPLAPLLDVELRRADDTVVLVVRGEVDLATAPVLREGLRAAADSHAPLVVVDLTDVSFMGSVGVDLLLDALADARSRRRELRLAGVGGAVRLVLDATDTTDRFERYPTAAEAVVHPIFLR